MRLNSKKENPIYNILFNIILPVWILNKGPDFFSDENATIYSLILALAFPIAYGLKDYFRTKKANIVSIIGVLSVVLTGGLALLQLEGIYFAIKEAAVPFFIAIITLASIPYKKPLIYVFLFDLSLFDKELIQEKVDAVQGQKDFDALMNKTTVWLAGSFILSAVLNFIIAIWVFKDIDPSLEEVARRQILNEQIADMTWMGYVFIAFPLSFITLFIFWYISKTLKRITGLNLMESLKH